MFLHHPAKRRTRWRWATSAAALSALLGARPAGAEVQIQTIALSGQSAPDGNGTLSSFSSHPQHSFQQLNDAGQVAFHARLTGTTGGAADNAGIFRGAGGPLTQITRFPNAQLQNLFLNASGQVAFSARGDSVYPPGTENLWAVFRYDGQTLTEIVREGQPKSDGGGTFPAPTAAAINDVGQVIFIFLGDDTSSFVGDGQSISHLFTVPVGQSTPGGNGTFSPFITPIEFNQSGQFFMRAFIDGTSLLNDQGLFIYDGATLHQIARMGQPAPDGNGVFSNFELPSSWPAFNDSGQLAFPARLSGATSGHSRIYRSDGAELTEIARGGQPAPDGNGTLLDHYEDLTMAMNNSGLVAFAARLPGSSMPFVPNYGLYLGDGSSLVQIARTDQPAPDGGGTIVSLGNPQLNDAGQVAFDLCTLNACGIFLFDGSDLIKIVGEGDVIYVGDGDFRTISSVGWPLINNLGQVAFTADLNGGSTEKGIFLATISHTLPGDFNRDGTVDAADYVLWRKTGGTPTGYQDWRAHFGQISSPAASVRLPGNGVPEPASFGLALVALAVGAVTRQTSHRT